MENIDKQGQEFESVDFKYVLLKYVGYWHIFVASLIIALAVAYAFNYFSTPVYKVRANVLIQGEENTLNPYEQITTYKHGQRFQNEIGKLTSRSLIEKTLSKYKSDYLINYYKKTRIRTTEMYGGNPFEVVVDSNHVQGLGKRLTVVILSRDKYRLEIDGAPTFTKDYISGDRIPGTPTDPISREILFGEQYLDSNFSFKIFLNQRFRETHLNTQYFFEIRDFQGVIDGFRSRLQTTNPDISSIVKVEFSYTNRRKAIEFLNRHVQTFIENNLSEKNYQSDRAIEFIDEQLGSITDSLSFIEDRLQSFKVARGVMDISSEANTIYTNYYELLQQKRDETMRQRLYDYLFKYFESNIDSEILAPSGMEIEDELLLNKINELNSLYAEKNSLLETTTELSPAVKAVESKIGRAKDLLKENLSNVVALTEIRLQDINLNLSQVKARINVLPETERELINIKRKFDINDEIYTFLLQKRAESAIAKASNAPDHKILEYAMHAAKVYPTSTLNYLIAVILGLVIPILFIFFRDFLNDKIYTKKDITSMTSVPILGMISHSRRVTNTIVLERPKSVISETFRTVRANIQFINPGKPAQVIALTSTISGEGKTFCSINLASVVSLSGKKTVILGSDLRKPKIFNDFNIVNDIGLSTYLIGKASIDEIIQETAYDKLSVITSGPIPPNPAELLESEAMAELITELRKRYDTIIIDTPPIGLVSDAVYCMKLADVGIFVLRQGYTPKGALATLNDAIKSTGIENISLVVNDVDLEQRSYGRYYGGGYGYGYSYGYGYGYGYGQYYVDKNAEKSENWFLRLFK